MSEAPRPIGKVGAPSALRYLHTPRILQIQDPGVSEDGWAFPALVELVLNTCPAKVAASTARGVETALGTPGVHPKAPCRCLPEHPGFPGMPVPEEGCDALCNSHGAALGPLGFRFYDPLPWPRVRWWHRRGFRPKAVRNWPCWTRERR